MFRCCNPETCEEEASESKVEGILQQPKLGKV